VSRLRRAQHWHDGAVERSTMNARIHPQLTLDTYLAWENDQLEKHEFYRGEIFAMVGARRIHSCVVGNVARELGNLLKGTPCRVFHAGMKLQIGDDTVLYPDVFITCDRADLAADTLCRAPTAVVEVLSPSTQSYDRSQKFSLYRRIDALKEYVLVDPDTRRVEAFRRNANNDWVLHDMSESDTLELACLALRVPMLEVFAGVEPPADPAAEPPPQA